jgi:hypothetical protein
MLWTDFWGRLNSTAHTRAYRTCIHNLYTRVFPISITNLKWRDPDSNRGHHDFQWRAPCSPLFLVVQNFLQIL